MNLRHFLRTLLLTCWLPFVLLAAGVQWESLQLTERKTQYIALGKIAISQLHFAIGSAGETEFFKRQSQILEGDEVKARALDRMHGLHPELPASEVKITVTHKEGWCYLKVAAVGEDQRYVRWYLDALMDEYQVFFGETLMKEPSSGAMGCFFMIERPELAVKDNPDLVGPLVLAGGAGLMAGVALMLLLAGAVSARQRRSGSKGDLLPD